MGESSVQLLGTYLKDCRARLDPASFGYSSARRRTPGLRREEVAQRANISPTWYTWLEQGRGGAPSAEVLRRLAAALMLTDPEHEHLFLLALGRPPEVRYRAVDSVSPRLQRLLDSLPSSPALIKTASWDVVAWNRAAAVVLTDYSKLPPGQRNILRFLFGNPAIRAKQHDWENVARFVVASFRSDAARAGLGTEVNALVEELSNISAEFAALWNDNDVLRASDSDGLKRLAHPILGNIELEYSAFAVDGRPDLGMIVYTPLDRTLAERIKMLADSSPVVEDKSAA